MFINDPKSNPPITGYYVEDITDDWSEDRVVRLDKFAAMGGDRYVVRVGKAESCGCKGFRWSGNGCRHVKAVKKLIEKGKI